MRASELAGAQLDYWVAVAEGERLSPVYPDPDPDTGRYWLQQGAFGSVKKCPKYSTDWSAGGPIVERLRIGTMPRAGGTWGAWLIDDMDPSGLGETPLIAAMRAHVASKVGDEVPEIVREGR